MATAVIARHKLRADDVFFLAMALLILAIVVTGFGRTYFFQGMMFAKLPNGLVHVHGAVFVSWIFLLVAQTLLVATHNVKWHMKLGVLALILIPAMVVLGVLTLFDFVRRATPDDNPELILAADFGTLLIFVALTTWALLARRDSASHKRLMILGTVAAISPAIARWNVSNSVGLGIIFALPLLVLAYDAWQLKRVHRTTATAVALTATWVLTLLPFSKLEIWHQLVGWIRHT